MTTGRTPAPALRRVVGLRRLAVLAVAALALTYAGPASGVTEPAPVEATADATEPEPGAPTADPTARGPVEPTADPTAPAPDAGTTGTVGAAVATGSVSGTVTSGGRAAAGIYVSAYDPATGATASATTNAVGAYLVNGLPPGQYRLYFSGSGLVSEYYNDALTTSEADLVTVAAGATTQKIDAVLAVGGRIRGTVTGPNGPVGGVWVQAVSTSSYVSGASTASDGTYEIGGLAAGDYRVRFYGEDVGLVTEYYDDALVYADADLVTVAGAATTSGINAALVVGGSISGVVRGPSGPLEGAHVWASDADGEGYSSATTEADGSYVIDGLPAGSYRVAFGGPYDADLRDEYYDDVASWLTATLVPLAALQDVTGINAVLARESDPLFSDVPFGAPFHTEIEWLAEEGITTGYPDGTFRPSAPVERQAMAVFLYRLLGAPSFTPPATPTFRDVPTSSPFYTAIEWLAARGVTTGWPDGTFRPTATVERQAMAAFLYRYAWEPPFDDPAAPSFADVPTSSPFFHEIEWLASTGITTGWPDGTFRPTATVQRQAMAAFLMRFDAWW